MRSETSVKHLENDVIKRFYSYCCSRHAQAGKVVCSPHRISELSLKRLILGELKIHAQAISLDEAAVLETLKHQMNLDDSEQQNLLRQEIRHLEQRITELSRITADLYEDKVSSKISEQTFVALMQKNELERQNKQKRCDEVYAQLTAIQEKILSVKKWAEVVQKHIDLTDLCRMDIDELVDRIEVGESDYSSGKRQQEIRIIWRFVGDLNV